MSTLCAMVMCSGESVSNQFKPTHVLYLYRYCRPGRVLQPHVICTLYSFCGVGTYELGIHPE